MIKLPADALRGSIPPLVTPFKAGAVDYDTYQRLIERQTEAGSHGILVNGTTAEPAMLTIEERNRLIDVAVEASAGRLTVVAATGSQSLEETRRLTDHAAQAGVDALLIVTPYYSRPPQRGLVEYYVEVTRELTIPWMIYHIPGRAAVDVKLETLREIAARSSTWVGMKHASLDLAFASDALVEFGEALRIFVGLEELSFPLMAIGGCGLMNAVGNVLPRPLVALCEAMWRGDLLEGRRLHRELIEINRSVFFDTNPIPIKYMMKRLGIIAENEHRLPMMPATSEVEQRLDEVLRRLDLLES